MAITKIEKKILILAVAKMRTAIDDFGEGLEESGIQWKSYEMDDKVRAVYDLCHATICDLQTAIDQLPKGR